LNNFRGIIIKELECKISIMGYSLGIYSHTNFIEV